MTSTAINANLLFYDRFTQFYSMLAYVRFDSFRGSLGHNLFGYNPYHQELTPEEKLKAMAKNQEKQSQLSIDPRKSRVQNKSRLH